MITPDFVVSFAAEGLKMALLIAGPMLGFGLVIGVAVSVFQAVTSIQELTLTFIPKILAVMLSILIFFPWMIEMMINYTAKIIINIPMYVQ
ncbi:Flagellar biosynthesis protein FliQ [hydrothermal vent metagenome]|uniref:Flagellar biosynthetic protein FliQ n=1 Tax=hydrothermal vent metagenome TaxID=652676 RepID=A0A3B1C6X0_9ZZZZ